MQVTSSDETSIHADELGQGPPILFVPGTTLDASSVAAVSARLAPKFRCLSMDRRGRGKSGDSPTHSLDQEVEDVLSLARAIGGPLALFGHSYGGLCVLKAAARCSEVASLILYEPPINDPIPSDTRASIRIALDRGQGRQAMLLFLEEVVQLRPVEMEFVKSLPDEWFAERATTTVREMEAGLTFDAARDLNLPDDLPVSILLGSESTDGMRCSADHILSTLPRSVLHTLEGQAHNALLSDPDQVGNAIEEHMERVSLLRRDL
jgi:pimeloyl-ACP methyl ester carboxylesterase